jgi:hypothetical protein
MLLTLNTLAVSGTTSADLTGSIIGNFTGSITSSISGTFTGSYTSNVNNSSVYTLTFDASQRVVGTSYVSGTYVSQVYVSSQDNVLQQIMQVSSSIPFTPIWTSLDGTVAYLTGSIIYAQPPMRGDSSPEPKVYYVSVTNVNKEYTTIECPTFNVNIFDYNSPLITLARIPAEIPGLVLRNVYYSIRNATTNEIIVPFETEHNATLVSSNASGMYFTFDMSSLLPGLEYVIDIMIDRGGTRAYYRQASSPFRLTKPII